MAIDLTAELGEQLTKLLMNEDNVKNVVCSQLSGELRIFVRNGKLQKVFYSRGYDLPKPEDFFTTFFETQPDEPSEQLISDSVYKRFAYMIGIALGHVDEKHLEYGHITFNYSFVEVKTESQISYELANIGLRYDGEIHIPSQRN